MADMSLPPLSLLPLDAPPGQGPLASPSAPLSATPPAPTDTLGMDTPPGVGEGFVWPVPALAGYPVSQRPLKLDPCEVEGLNGRAMNGWIMAFDPHGRQIRLRLSTSRGTITLRFDQFRRLRLLQTLNPVPPTTDTVAPAAELLNQRPALPYTLVLTGDQGQYQGLTVGYEHTAYGVFLFEPVDLGGAVRRIFVPDSSYTKVRVGQLLGEALVEQSLVTPEQVHQALEEQQQMRQQRLGDMLVVKQIISPEELAVAIEQQARMPMVRIGEALTALGFISEAQLEEALSQQQADRSIPLGELLLHKGWISHADLQTALARKMGYPIVDVLKFPVDTQAVTKLPYAVATRQLGLPLMLHAGRLVVALEDPTQRLALDDMEFASDMKVVPVLARTGVLMAAIDRAYEKLGAIDFNQRGGDGGGGLDFEADDAGKLLATLELQDKHEQRLGDDEERAIEQSDNSLVRLINTMIIEAQSQRVSDIHIETQPGREKLKIRFRKDGVLRPYMELPHTYRNAIVARLKIMCDLDISERRKPQDGKINFARFVPGQALELRVVTIPTNNNLEDVVLRLLASAKPLPLAQLGLADDNRVRLETAVGRPYGLVLCVGPTGSGKTTTLHSAMAHINTPDRKIWTAEDPIEITQAGLRQVQVNNKIDWTFAKALRSFLRADPDVIMVGEIRDRETAQMAVEASLTGHLVLSTLHTNSAPETVTRLLDMGMDPFNFADSLLAVLAQRLVRRLCPDCRTASPATAEQVQELANDWLHAWGDAPGRPEPDALVRGWAGRHAQDGRLRLHRPVGCPACDHTGWRGRVAVHELMTVTRAIRNLIQTGARAEIIQQTALSEGMRTLRHDGLEKVLAGHTTLEEVRAASN